MPNDDVGGPATVGGISFDVVAMPWRSYLVSGVANCQNGPDRESVLRACNVSQVDFDRIYKVYLLSGHSYIQHCATLR